MGSWTSPPLWGDLVGLSRGGGLDRSLTRPSLRMRRGPGARRTVLSPVFRHQVLPEGEDFSMRRDGELLAPAFKLRIQHISGLLRHHSSCSIGSHSARLGDDSWGTHSWKLWAANYAWTYRKSAPRGRTAWSKAGLALQRVLGHILQRRMAQLEWQPLCPATLGRTHPAVSHVVQPKRGGL